MSSAQLKQLLNAKKSAARLTHPYAKYSGTRLSCSLCGASTAGLKEVQWSSHLVSKGHRVNVRKAEAQAAQLETDKAAKRPRDDDADEHGQGKRAREDDDAQDEPDPNALPDDFFADPSMAPPPRAQTPDEVEESRASTSADIPLPVEVEDDEWAAFEASLSNAPPPTLAPIASATIFAAPVRFTITRAVKLGLLCLCT